MKSKTLKYSKFNETLRAGSGLLMLAALIMAVMIPPASCAYIVNQSPIKKPKFHGFDGDLKSIINDVVPTLNFDSDNVDFNGIFHDVEQPMNFGHEHGTWILIHGMEGVDNLDKRLFEFHPNKPTFFNYDGWRDTDKGQNYMGKNQVLVFYGIEEKKPHMRKSFFEGDIESFKTPEKIQEFNVFINKKIDDDFWLLSLWNQFPYIKNLLENWNKTPLFVDFQEQIKKLADGKSVEETNKKFNVDSTEDDLKIFILNILIYIFALTNPKAQSKKSL